MNKELLNQLAQQADLMDKEIEKLTLQKDSIRLVIRSFSVNGVSQIVPATNKTVKSTAAKKVQQIKNTSPDGKEKFGSYLFNILKDNPRKSFYPAELAQAMAEAVKNGKIKEVTKDLGSSVSSNMYNFSKRNKVIKVDPETAGQYRGRYQYNSGDNIPTEKAEKKVEQKIEKKITPAPARAVTTKLEGLDMIDEKIIEILNLNPMIEPQKIADKIRLSDEYLEISRNLSGTLLNSVTESLNYLTKNNIVLNFDNSYEVNPKSGY